uniref:Uncharacterized protein n=1 Tax=Schizaphis graminum TaxID=13262 RepID=A0A2S2P783_SCHGA
MGRGASAQYARHETLPRTQINGRRSSGGGGVGTGTVARAAALRVATRVQSCLGTGGAAGPVLPPSCRVPRSPARYTRLRDRRTRAVLPRAVSFSINKKINNYFLIAGCERSSLAAHVVHSDGNATHRALLPRQR